MSAVIAAAPRPRPPSKTWRYFTWVNRSQPGISDHSAMNRSAAFVVAWHVEFVPGYVVWRDYEGAVVLAERTENVNQLVEVDNLGSSTRGIRPSVTEAAS